MTDRLVPTTWARTASAMAIAVAIALPATAYAQAAQQGAEATNAQPTPNQPAPDPIATNAQSTGQQTSTPSPTTVEPPVSDEVVVTGIRASLERSIAIKRDSTGIVDAISAEDIGKFPDTNLAESLQRVTGVSIDRRNGEGAEVTVRGFGPQYNLVTLNGRQLAASDQDPVGGGESADFGRNTTRSFDFSNLASEGVKTLEVYKTGRAAIPSGGIGSTINVVTRRPLDARESGLNGSIGVKADYDTSTDDCVSCGSHVTPEVSGLASWSNPDQTFGVSLFGSYQKRNFSNIAATVQGWNITTLAAFLDPAAGNVRAASTGQPTTINNQPSDLNQLVGRPNDARYHFAEGSRERINGQAVAQFKPTETFEVTADALFAQNRTRERRSDESNWFNRPFDVVTFDSGHSVATTTYLHEVISGETKDAGFEQQYRAQKSQLQDYGLNAKWSVTDNFTVTADGHIGTAKSTPDNPNGMTSTLVAISSPTLQQHSWDYDGGFPIETVNFVDPATTSANHPTVKGNGNGVLDVGDLGSQVGRQVATTFHQNIKEGRIDAGWDFGGGGRLDFGGDYRTTITRSDQTTYYQTLGDWGNAAPRDVEQIAPGVVQPFCLVCRFSHYDPQASGQALLAFRAEDPTVLYNALNKYYLGIGHANSINGYANDRLKEDIWSVYGQFSWKGQIGDHDANLVAGARYEQTKVRANSVVATPADIRWQSDNDFTTDIPFTSLTQFNGRGSYNNLLPSMDLQFNIKHNLISRFSFSRTLSRPSYGDLFASRTAGAPNDATAVGGVAGGSTGNPDLDPITSDNFDLSLEWYFKPDSYVSIGFFDKRVHNFISRATTKEQLFDLRDPSSGAPGSRSGTAKAQLQAIGADITDVNLFTYTALLQQNSGNTTAATATFLANYNAAQRALNQAFVDSTLAAVDIIADANDPFFTFNLSSPVNNKDAEINGFEIAGQYFLGNTGIGVNAQYTHVHGNIGYNVALAPGTTQFALLGLSDSANASLIYDKYGISARLTFNWRDKFLSNADRADGYNNPEFTKAHKQVDFNVSYDITPQLAVSVEGINIFEEGISVYGRSTNQIWTDQEAAARYLVGARFRF